jgi:hypothetical protein
MLFGVVDARHEMRFRHSRGVGLLFVVSSR